MKLPILFSLITISFLSSCSKAEQPSKGVPVAISTVNFNADRGIRYVLYDTSHPRNLEKWHYSDLSNEDGVYKNGYPIVAGGIAETLASGGNKECCLNLPDEWQPRLTYTLKWDEDGRNLSEAEKKTVYEQKLEVPRYQKPEDVYIVFLEGKEVELVMGGGDPETDSWRGSVKGGTLGACMKKHSKKFCYQYLPHYESENDNSAERFRVSCRKELENKKEVEMITKEVQTQRVEFLKQLLQQYENEPAYKLHNEETRFGIQREKRPNRVGKTFCEVWSQDCKEDFDRKAPHRVSRKEMCDINWRSPEFGE